MAKIRFSTRLPPEVFAGLQASARAENATLSDTIGKALDALDRERKAGISIPDRVALLEKNPSVILDLVVAFSEKIDEKFSEAGSVERNRMKSLLKLVEIKNSEHDEAEQIRFYRFLGGTKKPDSP